MTEAEQHRELTPEELNLLKTLKSYELLNNFRDILNAREKLQIYNASPGFMTDVSTIIAGIQRDLFDNGEIETTEESLLSEVLEYLSKAFKVVPKDKKTIENFLLWLFEEESPKYNFYDEFVLLMENLKKEIGRKGETGIHIDSAFEKAFSRLYDKYVEKISILNFVGFDSFISYIRSVLKTEREATNGKVAALLQQPTK